MKKGFKVLLCITLLVACLCGCGGKSNDNSLIGKWVVTAYEVDGEVLSMDEMCEHFGKNFADFESPVLLFQESGFVRIYKESGDDEEYTVNYTATGNTIEIYHDEEHMLYLEKEDDTLKVNMDSQAFNLIYTKE